MSNLNISNVLSVAKGGSGAVTLSGLLLGNGTSAFTTVAAPSGTIVGTSDSQSLTNKTYNGLTLVAQSVGFTIAGGTTSKTLTVSNTADVSGTNTGDQTSVSGNAGTATALQNPRTINTVSFDGTANIVVTAAAGTLTGTTLNSSVVTSSLTSVGTIASGVWSGTAILETKGGTNQTSYTRGDILYASAANTLSKLAIGSAGKVLQSDGTDVSWQTLSVTATFNRQTFSNAAATQSSLKTMIAQTGTMSASRTLTLISAASFTGQEIIISDESGTVTSTNTIVVVFDGSETADGYDSITIQAAYGFVRLYSNGTNWKTTSSNLV